MLYLAEVQKKTRVIGSGKAELKLLACQRTEQSWTAVAGEEVVPAPDDANYNAGALVMIELNTTTKQIQRHSEAGRQLVSILQNFSRLQEKAKTQEEEIEQWKQSLTYQSQELNRREMEMETRQEQLQQMEEDFSQLEQQRQDTEAARAEVNQLREEFERKSQELEGAWAQLRGEMGRLEERQAEMQQSATLDEHQAYQLQDLLNRLAGAVAPTEAVREQLNLSFETLSQQQGLLDSYYQELEQQRNVAQQHQEEVDRQTQDLHQRWQEWHLAQDVLEQKRAEMKEYQGALNAKQEYEQTLLVHIRAKDELHQQVYLLAESSDKVTIGTRIDRAALEEMPLEELKTLTQDMEKELEKLSGYVRSQEEELGLQQQTIDDLQTQIQQANEYDRLQLENQLTDEQESYRMLNETLVGQRRNLQEREAGLKQHQAVLARRQGISNGDSQENAIDLEPVLTKIDTLRQQQGETLKILREEVQALRTKIEQSENTVNEDAVKQDTKRNELKQAEQHYQSQRSAVAELWGKVNTYQAILQPMQEGISGLKQKVEAIAQMMAQFQEASDYQLQAIAEMRQMIGHLTGNQSSEFVAS